MNADPKPLFDRVLSHLRAFYAEHAASGSEGAGDAATIAASLAPPLEWRPREPATLTASRHFLPALESAANGPLTGLAADLRAVAPHAAWGQNPVYKRDMPKHFLDNYASLHLVGPDGPYVCDRVRAGFVLFGPNLHYAAHRHPARELYLVVDGTAVWWRAGGAPVERPPGSVLLHTENRDHATTMGAQALLALWAWTGEIMSPAVMSPADEVSA